GAASARGALFFPWPASSAPRIARASWRQDGGKVNVLLAASSAIVQDHGMSRITDAIDHAGDDASAIPAARYGVDTFAPALTETIAQRLAEGASAKEALETALAGAVSRDRGHLGKDSRLHLLSWGASEGAEACSGSVREFLDGALGAETILEGTYR